DSLCRLDKEKGPFEWRLIPQPAAPQQSQPPGQLPFPNSFAHSAPRSPVPRVILALNWDWLSAWTPQQKDAVYTVLTTINGEHTIEDIKGVVPLPPALVDEILRMLLELKVIVISA
nr:hypothetical protein [Ktedonobacteraceae bacterium]